MSNVNSVTACQGDEFVKPAFGNEALDSVQEKCAGGDQVSEAKQPTNCHVHRTV